MRLGKPFVVASYPSSYGDPTYHSDLPSVKPYLASLRTGTFLWTNGFYDYDSIAEFLKIACAGVEENRLTTQMCAMQRAGQLHGYSRAESNSNRHLRPPTYIWEVPERRRAVAELTELAFDSLAGLERATDSLTLSIVMHGEGIPGRAWTEEQFKRKLSVWTGDSVFHDAELRAEWEQIVDLIVERVITPWQRRWDAQVKKKGSRIDSNTPPAFTSPNHSFSDWEQFHQSLPSTSSPTRNTGQYRSPPTSPTRQSAHPIPFQSASPQKGPASHNIRTPGAASTSRYAAPVTPAPTFAFTDHFSQVLLSVGWDVGNPSNWEALETLYRHLRADDDRAWPQMIVKALKLRGAFVSEVYEAALKGGAVAIPMEDN